MRPIPQPRHKLAVLVLLAVSTSAVWLALRDDNLSGIQVQIITAAMKQDHQQLFTQDPVYGQSNLWLFKRPAFHAMISVLTPDDATDYRQYVPPFQILAGVLLLAYMLGMYMLLYRQTRSWAAALFVSVLSCVVAYTLGKAFWGVGPLGSIIPQAVTIAATPYIVLAYLSWRGRRLVLLAFLAAGLVGNIHLIMAMNITLALMLTHVCLERFRPRAWLAAVLGGLCALVGALPHLWYYLSLRHSLGSGAGMVSMELLRQAFGLGETAVLYPGMISSLLDWLILLRVLVLVVAAVFVLSRIERFRMANSALWLWFGASAVFLALVVHGASQLAGMLMGTAPPIIDFMQASNLVMLPLYVFFAQALVHMFRLLHAQRRWLRAACAVFMVVWILPSDNFRVARFAIADTVTMFGDEETKPKYVRKHHEQHRVRMELAEIGQWARDFSDPNAVFIMDNPEFRMFSQRSLLATSGDVEYFYYLAPGRLAEWVELVKAQRELLRPSGGGIRAADAKLFVARLAEREQYKGVTQWYLVARRQEEGADLGTMELRSPEKWGRYYRLYRLR